MARLWEASGGELAQSLLWRELLACYDIVDVASVVFADRYGCWGFLDLWRAAPAGPFIAQDQRYLAEVAGAFEENCRLEAQCLGRRGNRQDSPGRVDAVNVPTRPIRRVQPRQQ